MSPTETAEKRQYLSFALAGSNYGLGILQVREILQYEPVTAVPGMPASVRGIINLRGSVVPVIDLAIKLGLPPTAVTKRTCILVVEARLDATSTIMGVIADAVQEVLELGPGDVEPPPPFGTRIRADFLLGMGKVGRGFVLLLDLDRVITAGERELLAAADAAPAPGPEAMAPPGQAPEAAAP